MALQITRITNNNQGWEAKRRYRVNEVVSYLGSVYQNFTGGNSNPSLATDWVFLNTVNNIPIVYANDFIADSSKQFTVPEGIYIKNAFLNNISVNASDRSQIGQVVTITSSQVGDLVTLTN